MLIGWLRGLYWKVTLFLLFVYHSSCWSLTSSSMSPWIKMIIVCSVHYWFFFFSPFLWACWWMPRTFLNNCSNNNCSIHIIISFPPPDDELHSSAHLVFMMNENLDAPSLDPVVLPEKNLSSLFARYSSAWLLMGLLLQKIITFKEIFTRSASFLLTGSSCSGRIFVALRKGHLWSVENSCD